MEIPGSGIGKDEFIINKDLLNLILCKTILFVKYKLLTQFVLIFKTKYENVYSFSLRIFRNKAGFYKILVVSNIKIEHMKIK